MELTFYGGVSEIGGNKILLNDKETTIFIDFGKSFSKEREYFSPPYLEPRKPEHLLALGILPEIEGIYKLDTSPNPLDGVLISHPHTDHYDYIRYLKDDIPIHCGEGTRAVIEARECCSRAHKKEYSLCNLTQKGFEEFKTYETFHSKDHKRIGNIDYIPIHVDHSVCGAYAFVLETSNGPIGYTGDFRMHGPKREMTREMIDLMKDEKLELLIIEGTNVSGSTISSEDEVREKATEVARRAEGIVFVTFSPTDVDRLRTFYDVSSDTGRRFVITPRQAYLIKKLKGYVDLPSDVEVYAKDKDRTYEYENEVFDEFKRAEDLNNTVTVLSFYDFNELGGIDPPDGSVYIMSQSEPFNEEMEIEHEKLKNWLEHFGLPLYNIHASGHASPQELKEVVREINPKRVSFIHTEAPRLFGRYISDLGVKILVPREGEDLMSRW